MSPTHPAAAAEIAAEKSHIELALRKIRPYFDASMPDLEILAVVLRNGHGDCTPDTLAAFAEAQGSFTTGEAMQYFQVGKYKIAGCLAPLTRTGKITKLSKLPGDDENSYSRYAWVPVKAPAKRR